MSEDVYYSGKLIPVEQNGLSIEETALRLLDEHEIARNAEYDETALEQLLDDLYDEYVFAGGVIYEVKKHAVDIYSDIFKSTQNEDGTIDFIVKYYNGGCGFGEAIESALKNKT